MNAFSITISFIFSLWKYAYLPLLLWWIIGSTVLLAIAEGVFYLLPTRQVALRASLWRITTILLLLLPLALAFSPFRMDFSIPSISLLETKNISQNMGHDAGRNQSVANNTLPSFKPPIESFTAPPIISNSTSIKPNDETFFAFINSKNKQVPKSIISENPKSFILFLAYLSFILCLFLRKRIARSRIKAFHQNTAPCGNQSVIDLVNSCRLNLKIKMNITIKIRPENSSPIMICYRRPILLLPQYMVDEWSESELRPIIMHELCHIAHRDVRYEKICNFLASIMFFYPIWFWLRNRLEQTREVHCDAIAANECCDSGFYVQQLIRIMESAMLPLQKTAQVYPIQKGAKTLNRLNQLLNNSVPCQLKTKNWQKSCLVIIGMISILLFGGLRCNSPLSNSDQIHPKALAILNAYQQRSLDAHNGGYIVAHARHQNFFTAKQIAEKEPNTRLFYDSISSVTEYSQAPFYRREMSKYILHDSKKSFPDLLAKGITDGLSWNRVIEIFNETEYAIYRKDHPDQKIQHSRVKSRRDEISSSFAAPPHLKKKILDSNKLIIADVTPLKFLYSLANNEISELVEQVEEGKLVASYSISGTTHFVSLKTNHTSYPIINWYIPKSTFPYPTRIEIKNGSSLSEVKEISYTPDKIPKTYSSVRYVHDKESNQPFHRRAVYRYDVFIDKYQVGVKHDPILFAIKK